MSQNKSKYFVVTTTAIVRANNKTEARRAALSRTRVPNTEVLGRTTESNRVYADDARMLANSLDNS